MSDDYTPTVEAALVQRLRTVGGVYDHVALYVESDSSTPALPTERRKAPNE